MDEILGHLWQVIVHNVRDTFDVNARSLCEIAYAPDHVRCWTKQAYKALGIKVES